jgi:nucleoside-diphosphate-sugar epimerase
VVRLFFLGVGTVAEAVRRACPSLPAVGTTRAAPDARFQHIEPIPSHDAAAIRSAVEGAHVLVSIPPDGHSDREFAEAVIGAAGVVYLSSTAVYPSAAGVVTESSELASSGERALRRIAAESTWREVGASVVRLPAFYGVGTGLHISLARGTFRMPGLGANFVSRVHEDDAARFVHAAFEAPPRSLLLAGDDEPAPVAEVVGFVCSLFGLAAPASSEGSDVPLSLRGDRSIDNRATRSSFGVELIHPSYREGYRSILETRSY